MITRRIPEKTDVVVSPPVRPKAPADTHSGTLAHGRINSNSNNNSEFDAVQDARGTHDAIAGGEL